MKAPTIEPKKLQAELQELAGTVKVKVKLDKHIDVATSIRETDRVIDIRLNPNRLRSPQKLEEHLGIYRSVASGGI